MKTTIDLISVAIIVLSFLTGGCSDAEHESLKVEITNEGTIEISNVELSMIGGEGTIALDKLAAGQSSGTQIFTLPILEEDIPDSWGDFSGVYTQENIVKDISVMKYEIHKRSEIRIEIDDSSFKIIYP